MAVNPYGVVHRYHTGMCIPTHFATLPPPRPCLNPHYPYTNSRGVHSQFRQIASIQRWPNHNQLIQNVNATASSLGETKPLGSNNMGYKAKPTDPKQIIADRKNQHSVSNTSTTVSALKVNDVRKGTL